MALKAQLQEARENAETAFRHTDDGELEDLALAVEKLIDVVEDLADEVTS